MPSGDFEVVRVPLVDVGLAVPEDATVVGSSFDESVVVVVVPPPDCDVSVVSVVVDVVVVVVPPDVDAPLSPDVVVVVPVPVPVSVPVETGPTAVSPPEIDVDEACVGSSPPLLPPPQ